MSENLTDAELAIIKEWESNVSEARLENTNTVMKCHSEKQCAGDTCALHNRSDHHMRGFPQRFRYDKNLMERICPHGCGHPDPDDFNVRANRFAVAMGEPDDYIGLHGCCGCCAPPKGGGA